MPILQRIVNIISEIVPWVSGKKAESFESKLSPYFGGIFCYKN